MVYRDAAQVVVRSSPGEVGELLANPGVLSSLGLPFSTIEPGPVVRPVGRDEYQATTIRGDVSLRFKVEPCPEGTRLLVSSKVEPANPADMMAHMFFPQKRHQRLQDSLDRFRMLVESLRHKPPVP